MILLYHTILPDNSPSIRFRVNSGISQSVFDKQIQWISKHRLIVSLDQYLQMLNDPEHNKEEPVVITFDDGFRQTFDCILPIIQRRNTPVTIFLCSAHIGNQSLLWFSYLKALCFESKYSIIGVDNFKFDLDQIQQRINTWKELMRIATKSGNPTIFVNQLAEKYPLDCELTNPYLGMTHNQIEQGLDSNLVEFGGHTVNHPFLNRIPVTLQREEIINNKDDIEQLTKKPVRYFAYPSGEYNKDSVNLIEQAGYEAALAVIPKRITRSTFEIERVGIYSQSTGKFKIKMLGGATFLRRLGIHVG